MLEEIIKKSFSENNGQWYKMHLTVQEVSNGNHMVIQSIVETFARENEFKHRLILMDTDLTAKGKELYLHTDQIELIDRLRDKFFMLVCDKPEGDLGLLFNA